MKAMQQISWGEDLPRDAQIRAIAHLVIRPRWHVNPNIPDIPQRRRRSSLPLPPITGCGVMEFDYSASCAVQDEKDRCSNAR